MEKLYNVMVKTLTPCAECGLGHKVTWKPVRPTHGVPYQWTKEVAEKYIETYENYGHSRGSLQIKEI
jgi:hypothetical protein